MAKAKEIGDVGVKTRNRYMKIIFIIIIAIVVLIAIYLAFFAKKGLQYSPPIESSKTVLSYANSRELLAILEQEGIDWYCGKSKSYTDAKGNVYGAKELEELKKILGHEEELRNEFCN